MSQIKSAYACKCGNVGKSVGSSVMHNLIAARWKRSNIVASYRKQFAKIENMIPAEAYWLHALPSYISYIANH